jgi:signal recognition particle subunit SRP54
MEELVTIKSETHPVEILFVADAMTWTGCGAIGGRISRAGRDHRSGPNQNGWRCPWRCGASIKQVTGQPVKFVGVGEKYDALEPFYPDRVAQRILGMGDVLSLIEQVQDKIDQSDAEKSSLRSCKRISSTLDDFRSQLRQVKKLVRSLRF